MSITARTVSGLSLADLVRAGRPERIDPADGWQTSTQIAEELGMSEFGARRRLDKLVRQGKVEKRRGYVEGRPGFPPWFYRPIQPPKSLQPKGR